MNTFIFQILSPTVSFILGRLGIPILGNIAIPSWLWHGPSNHFFSAAFFSGRKWFTSKRTAFCWHRARPTDRRWGLVVHPADPSHTISFLSISSSSLFHVGTTQFILPPLHLQCFLSQQLQPFSSPKFQMIPCYSSNSPEDSLIPCFPAQSTDHVKGIQRQNRFTTRRQN